jgi:hypothetical protein
VTPVAPLCKERARATRAGEQDFLSPLRGLERHGICVPRAYALGCILSPLRGFGDSRSPLADVFGPVLEGLFDDGHELVGDGSIDDAVIVAES